jgi:hypothetical protein
MLEMNVVLSYSYSQNLVVCQWIDEFYFFYKVSLMDLSSISTFNDHFRYILIVIDVFSIFFMSRTFKNKNWKGSIKSTHRNIWSKWLPKKASKWFRFLGSFNEFFDSFCFFKYIYAHKSLWIKMKIRLCTLKRKYANENAMGW